MNKFQFEKVTTRTSVQMLVDALKNTEVYLVGGAVRDILLDIEPKDIDLAISDDIHSCLEKLKSANIKVIETGLKHNTITAIPLHDEPTIEITSFRNNSTSIEDDLCARDFTINAFAFKITNSANTSYADIPNIIDPLDGINDLKNKILRVCENTVERFIEDPLRLYRLIRFSTTLSFTIEKNTDKIATQFIADCQNSSALNPLAQISIERKREELNKILISRYASSGIRLLADFNLLQDILPEVVTFINYEQNEFHKHDLFNHTLTVIDNVNKIIENNEKFADAVFADRDNLLILQLAALLHDVGKPASLSIDEDSKRHFYLHEVMGLDTAGKILNRLKYSDKIVSTVLMLIEMHMRPLDCGAPGLRRILKRTGENFELWRILKEADALGCKAEPEDILTKLANFDANIFELRETEKFLRDFKLAINGKDLIGLGLEEGKQIGEILNELTELVLDNPEQNERDILLEIAQAKIKNVSIS